MEAEEAASGAVAMVTSDDEWTARLAALRSDERAARREALRWVARALAEDQAGEGEDGAARASARFELARAPVLAAMDDEAEACRELAIRATAALVEATPPSDYVLTYVMASLRARLAGPETAEPSEELRLQATTLLRDVVRRYAPTAHLRPFYDDCVDALIKTLADDYAEVKKVACRTVALLAQALPEDFHMRAEALVTAALPNLDHRHYKVRAAAVECLGAAVMHGNENCFQSANPHMAKKMLDDNPTVRLQIVKEVSNWMLNLRDRYSYFHNMIPFILTGISDSMEEVAAEAKTAWENIGLQYMNENEEVLKDQMDYLAEPPEHYPPTISRPNLGCRTLVIRNMGKIVPAIQRELEGWISEVRHRSAQILSLIVLHAETKNIQYSTDIIGCLLKGAKDSSNDVIAETNRAGELFGYFIEPNIWWNFLMADLDSYAGLVVLSNIVKGSDPDDLRDKYIKRMLKELSCTRLRTNAELKFQMNLLNVCESIMNVCGIDCQSVGQEMFDVLFTIYAISANEEIEHHALCLLGKFRETIQFGSNLEDLYCVFIRSLLVNIATDPCFWSARTPDKFIFNTILLHTGHAIGLHLHLISPILTEALTAIGVSPDIKLEVFTSLCSILLERDERFKLTEPFKLEAFMKVILYDIITRNLPWSAGKAASSLRTSAICCLCAVLQENEPASGEKKIQYQPIDLFPDVDNLQKTIDDLLPVVRSLIKDQSKNTRHYVLKAICCLVKLGKKKNCFKAEHLHKTYADVIGCLDDSSDDIRKAAVETLCILFMSRPEPYDIVSFSTHIDALYSAMLLHLDDPDAMFQENVLDALKKICVVHPKLLKGKVDASTKLFRNQKALEHLDKHLESLSI